MGVTKSDVGKVQRELRFFELLATKGKTLIRSAVLIYATRGDSSWMDVTQTGRLFKQFCDATHDILATERRLTAD